MIFFSNPLAYLWWNGSNAGSARRGQPVPGVLDDIAMSVLGCSRTVFGKLNMMILGLDFSTDRRSAAVIDGIENGELSVRSSVTDESLRNPWPLIQKALREAEIEREAITRLAVGLGPGSYTGIRASLAVAQGWQLGRSIQTCGVSTFQALAAQAQNLGYFGSVSMVVDAQRGELYLAEYEISSSEAALRGGPRIVQPAEVTQGSPILGPHAKRWFLSALEVFPDAAFVAALARDPATLRPACELEPVYLRENSFVKAPLPRIAPAFYPCSSRID